MSSFVKHNFFHILFFAGFVFSMFFVSPVFAVDTPLNLTGDYANKPSTNPENINGTGFQIVPDCSRHYQQQYGLDQQPIAGSSYGNGECGWADLFILVRNIMSLMLFLSASIAVISFTYAGFLYLTSFGDMGKVEQAHGIFSKVMIGFCFVFLGWLIVATILKTMGVNEAFSLLTHNTVTGVGN